MMGARRLPSSALARVSTRAISNKAHRQKPRLILVEPFPFMQEEFVTWRSVLDPLFLRAILTASSSSSMME